MKLSDLINHTHDNPEVEVPIVTSNSQSLQKQAALAIRSLVDQVNELEHKLASFVSAERLVKKLVTNEDLSSMQIFEKIGEYRSKSEEELQIIEKAMEMVKSGGMNLGQLSEDPTLDGLDPLTSYLLSEEN